MGRKQPSIAKITRPTLPAVLPRERLFRLLDEKPHSRVTWISGPPGAGKTTLVARPSPRSMKSFGQVCSPCPRVFMPSSSAGQSRRRLSRECSRAIPWTSSVWDELRLTAEESRGIVLLHGTSRQQKEMTRIPARRCLNQTEGMLLSLSLSRTGTSTRQFGDRSTRPMPLSTM